MHLLRTTSSISMGDRGTLQPGEWLCQDDTAFFLAATAQRGTVRLEHWDRKLNPEWMKLDDSANFDGSKHRSILLIRSGAIGDLLLLSPCIAALQAKYPEAQIWLCCFKKHWDIFAQGDMHFVEYPFRAMDTSEFDLIIPLENVVEQATDDGIHATDAFAAALGVTVTDYKPVYRVTESELLDLCRTPGAIIVPEGGKRSPRVGIQLHASSPIRGYPIAQWNAVLHGLVERGWEIMLLGNRDGIKGAPPAIKDCSGLSFREAAAVLATCDVFCGVDSSFFNLCPALGVPAIGLFGPVNWRTRIKEGSGQLALTTAASCAPCGWTNSRSGRQFPEDGPCSRTGRCEPLAAISPERIIAKIDAYRK